MNTTYLLYFKSYFDLTVISVKTRRMNSRHECTGGML